MDLKQLRHDFINNSLRIEVLTKLIVEQLQDYGSVEKQYKDDLEKFLKLMQDHLSEIKTKN